MFVCVFSFCVCSFQLTECARVISGFRFSVSRSFLFVSCFLFSVGVIGKLVGGQLLGREGRLLGRGGSVVGSGLGGIGRYLGREGQQLGREGRQLGREGRRGELEDDGATK